MSLSSPDTTKHFKDGIMPFTLLFMERYAVIEYFVPYLLLNVAKNHQKSLKMNSTEML